MKHLVCLMALIGLGCLQMRAAEDQEVTLRLIETSDVHGCYFPYDFIGRRPVKGLSSTYKCNFLGADNKQ